MARNDAEREISIAILIQNIQFSFTMGIKDTPLTFSVAGDEGTHETGNRCHFLNGSQSNCLKSKEITSFSS